MVARLPSPSLLPSREEAGMETGNAGAMTAEPHPAEVPVSTQPQPSEGLPSGSATWQLTPSAGTA